MRQAHPGEQIVDGEVLVLAPCAGPATNRDLAQRPPAAVVVLEGFADGEVARRADIAPPQAAREEPVRGPASQATERGEPLDHRRRGRRDEDRKSTRLNSS